MHVNERGRVQIRRARTRTRARANVSVRTRMRAKVWVHACEYGRGCPQHICDLHAQLEHRGLRSLQLRLELRGLTLCNGELGFELNRPSPRARGCDPAPARRSRRADVQASGWAGGHTGSRACQRAGGDASGRAGMRASRQANMQASGRDSAPARRSEWASRQARGALPPCRLRPARTGQTASCRAGPVRRDGGCSCAGPATRFSRTLRVSCEKVMAAACRRVHVPCAAGGCGAPPRTSVATTPCVWAAHQTRLVDRA